MLISESDTLNRPVVFSLDALNMGWLIGRSGQGDRDRCRQVHGAASRTLPDERP
jgi:hypothetical protein